MKIFKYIAFNVGKIIQCNYLLIAYKTGKIIRRNYLLMISKKIPPCFRAVAKHGDIVVGILTNWYSIFEYYFENCNKNCQIDQLLEENCL